MNYNENLAVAQQPNNIYWLYFRCRGDGEELATARLPTPHYYKRHSAEGYSIAYKLDGYFHTKKGKDFLNDMIARLSLTLPIDRRYYITPTEGEAVNNRAYKLKEFQNCESIKVDIYTRKEAKANKYEDRVFWSLKYEAERRIRVFGSLDLDAFLDYAFNVFEVGSDVKDGSTLRAKCKSIFNWYESKNWKVGRVRKPRKKGEITMQMTEQRQKANAIKKAKTKAKFLGAIEVLKIKGAKLTAKSISEEAQIGIRTAERYYREYKEAQSIESGKDG